jgi:hypothetical protein
MMMVTMIIKGHECERGSSEAGSYIYIGIGIYKCILRQHNETH